MAVGMMLWLVAVPCHAQLPSGWSGVDIGSPTAGSDAWSNGVYTITGAGTGLSDKGDQMRFTSTTLSAGGNFRLTARVASFTGGAGSEVGLAVRKGTEPTDSTGAVAYRPLKGKDNNPNVFSYFARNTETGALYPWKIAGTESPIAAPCWLQLVRYGNNFAVYKSSDGTDWSQVQNSSGGVFSVSGPIQVGFFVSSGGTGTATATIDNVNLDTAPVLSYETSWVGDTFSSDYDSFVSGGAEAMWVAPDGTCYVASVYDEGGEGGKSYKNGKVVHAFSLPASSGCEGSITSDGTHLYYFGRPGMNYHEIYQTDMSGSFPSAKPLYFQTPLIDGAGKKMAVKLSGLAYGNDELYVGDPLTGQVLVANPAQITYGLATNVVNNIVTNKIDVSGVTDPAPEEVYQSEFQCDYVALTIPGLTVGQSYTVRLHFAELNPDDAAVGKRIMNLYAGSQSVSGYDIYAKAGALYKATEVSFADVKPDATGKLKIAVAKGAGTVDKWAAISGVEILNAEGSPFLRLNCGGGEIGDWKTTIHEIPSRAFSFTRPGPIAVDKTGNLWIVQEGTAFPASQHFTSTPGWAAIKSYDKNGHYLDKQITDVLNPTAISYDSAKDQLLVAENGPAQNIRIYDVYTGSKKTPVCAGTFGVTGGIFAGKTPGVYHDEASGGDARFFGLTGVGRDSGGNIYVACNGGPLQTDLRAFSPGGTLLWSLFGLDFCNTGDFDPTLGASDVWTPTKHYAMDYSGSTAGGEWKLKSYLVNPFAPYPFTANLAASSSVYRKIGPGHTPVMYTAGQGQIGPLYIYRFVGEQIVPCSSFTAAPGHNISIWIDSNGDGIQQPEEVSIASTYGGQLISFDVDNNGDLYLAMGGTHASKPNVQKFAFGGFNAHGVPVYSTTYTTVSTPPPFDKTWGNKARLRYAGGAKDTMYLLGETNPNASATDYNYGATLACYDQWSTTPVKRFITVLPTPASDPNFLGGGPPYSRDGFIYQAFDVANGVSFVTDLWGVIHVVDPQGNLVTKLQPGPEVNGLCAWEDEIMGVRAHYNPATGEYDILQENSGFRARENLYRWNPNGPIPAR